MTSKLTSKVKYTSKVDFSVFENMEKMMPSVEAELLTDRYRLTKILNFADAGHHEQTQLVAGGF